MGKFAAMAALSASALGLSAGAAFADYTLNILHINDWHSRIESNNAFESTCSAEEETKGECIGGAARLVTAIADRRKALEGENVLLLNGGDNFQGSLFYATYKGEVEAEFLNRRQPRVRRRRGGAGALPRQGRVPGAFGQCEDDAGLGRA